MLDAPLEPNEGEMPETRTPQEGILRVERELGLERLDLCKALLYSNVEWVDAWEEPSAELPQPVLSQVHELNELVDVLGSSMQPAEAATWMKTPIPALENKTPLEVAATGHTRKIITALRRHQEGIPA